MLTIHQTLCFPYFLRHTPCFPYLTSDVFSIFCTLCFPFFRHTPGSNSEPQLRAPTPSPNSEPQLRASGSRTPTPCFPFNHQKTILRLYCITASKKKTVIIYCRVKFIRKYIRHGCQFQVLNLVLGYKVKQSI